MPYFTVHPTSYTVDTAGVNEVTVHYKTDVNLIKIQMSIDSGLTYTESLSFSQTSARFSIAGEQDGNYDCLLRGYYEETIVSDNPEILLSETNINLLNGETKTFNIRLSKKPTTDTLIGVTSNNQNVSCSPTTLTFTPSNYNTYQYVTVHGVESGSSTISLSSSNTSTVYVSATVVKEVTYGEIVTSVFSLELVSGDTGSFTVTLGSQPAQEQTVQLTSNNENIAVSPTSLTFSPSSYNIPQQVNVTGLSASTGTITLSSTNVANKTVSVAVENKTTPVEKLTISVENETPTMVEGTPYTLRYIVYGSPTTTEKLFISCNDSNVTLSETSVDIDSNSTGKVKELIVTPLNTYSSGSRTVAITFSGNAVTTRTIIATVTSTSTRVPVTGVEVNEWDIVLRVGASRQLQATVVPRNATNQTINWSASNPSVANVTSSGLVTAYGMGYSKITATTEEGGYEYDTHVNVTEGSVAGGNGIANAHETALTQQHSGSHEAIPNNPNPPSGSYNWVYAPRINPDGSFPQSSWDAIGHWMTTYKVQGSSLYDNVGLLLQNPKMWVWNMASRSWDVLSSDFEWGTWYLEDFWDDGNSYIAGSTEWETGVSGNHSTWVKIKQDSATTGRCFHPWGYQKNWRSNANWSNNGQPYIVTKIDFKLVKWDENGVDNLDRAQLVVNSGADWWSYVGATWQPDWSTNRDMAVGKYILATRELKRAWCTNLPSNWSYGLPTDTDGTTFLL